MYAEGDRGNGGRVQPGVWWVSTVGMSFAQADIGGGYAQCAGLESLRPFHNGAQGSAGRARTRISMAVARIVEDDKSVGIPSRICAVV